MQAQSSRQESLGDLKWVITKLYIYTECMLYCNSAKVPAADSAVHGGVAQSDLMRTVEFMPHTPLSQGMSVGSCALHPAAQADSAVVLKPALLDLLLAAALLICTLPSLTFADAGRSLGSRILPLAARMCCSGKLHCNLQPVCHFPQLACMALAHLPLQTGHH